MHSLYYKKNIFIIFLLLLFLTSCHRTLIPAQGDDLSLKIISITQDNVQTVQQGSRLLIMIPTDEFFEPLETSLKPEKINAILQMSRYVSRYYCAYPFSTVYVRGYANPLFPPYSPLVLSQKYANTIAAYLWSAGIPLNHIQTKGYGNNYFIANPETVPGRGFNSRVEIQIN